MAIMILASIPARGGGGLAQEREEANHKKEKSVFIKLAEESMFHHTRKDATWPRPDATTYAIHIRVYVRDPEVKIS